MNSPPRPYRGQQYSPDDMLPFIETSKGEKPAVLKELDIRVVVTGLLAETTQTLVLHNPNSRDVEGHVTVPLPDGAAVCGYALDVDGEMRDGVVVAKREARRILEAEERKGADPGLVEQVQGNVYQTRVYPIPSGGSRRLRVTYVSDLTVEGHDAAHHLPLRHAQHLNRVTLRVEVVQAPVTPELSGGVGNLTLERWEDRHVAEATLGLGMPVDDLRVRLPNLPDHFTALERTPDGEVFFCCSRRLTSKSEESPSWTPRRLALAWDASASRTNLGRDLEMLAKVVSGWADATVDVVVFRDRVDDEVRSFGPGERNELLTYLSGLPADGATNLTALDFSKPPHPDVDAWLLFSDGMGTMNRGLPGLGELPVFPITAQADCDSSLLGEIAAQTGGAYINLVRAPVEQAWLRMQATSDRVRVVESEGCEDLRLMEGGGRLAILGRLKGDRGSLTLVGPGAPRQPLALAAESASTGRSIARAWAGRQAQVLAICGDEFSDEVLELGRRYGLVTPGSSLLVLEDLEQYLEYGIAPPATQPDLRDAYNQLIETVNRANDRKQTKQIASVLKLWEERIDWWERDFLSGYEEKRRARTAAFERRQGRATRQAAMAQLAQPRSLQSADTFEADFHASVDDSLSFLCASETADDCRPIEVLNVDTASGQHRAPTIHVKPWAPDTPYLDAMRACTPEEAYTAYLEQRTTYANSPAFFLDCGDFLLTQDQVCLGVRVLSNLLELGLDDPTLMRMFAWRMLQAGAEDSAISVLSRVRRMRPDEPQSHRDLALALAQRWESSGEPADAVQAMELLYDVVLQQWNRFPEIEIIALMELNRLMDRAARAGVPIPERIDPRFRRLLDLDVRVSMSWDADLTDVDLHVFEPGGGHAYYANNLTDMGGLVSRDFTQGYGPEEYVLRRAVPGTYIIKAHYYGSHRQDVCGPCTVTVNVFSDYGRSGEKKQVLTLRLDQPSDQVTVGEITIDPNIETVKPHENGWKELFRSLKPGMTVDEIVAVVGQPKEIKGDGQLQMIYRPQPGVELHVLASPKLTAVHQVSDGAKLDLI